MVDARTLRHDAQAKNNTDEIPETCDECGRDLRVRSSAFDPQPSTDHPVKVDEEVDEETGEVVEVETEPASEHPITPASDTEEAECPVHGKVWGNNQS